MSVDEIQNVLQRYMARLEAILTADERATYQEYQQRIQRELSRSNTAPVKPTAAEQAVLDKIAGDTEAAALNKQFMVLSRVEHLPQ